MSAAEALSRATAAGVRVRLDGADLLIEAATAPPDALIEMLSHYKSDIVAMMRHAESAWSPADWRDYFNERAAIAEFDGGLSRTQAEARAFTSCIVEWLDRNFEPSPPGRCQACGALGAVGDTVPFGTERSGHVWLHSVCWRAWHDGRKRKAQAALAAVGVIAPVQFPNDFEKIGGL